MKPPLKEKEMNSNSKKETKKYVRTPHTTEGIKNGIATANTKLT